MTEVPTVLVVEDDEPLQDIVHDALKDDGFDLLTTASGEGALTLLNSGVVTFSALITDLIRPVVVRQNFAQQGEVRIIVTAKFFSRPIEEAPNLNKKLLSAWVDGVER